MLRAHGCRKYPKKMLERDTFEWVASIVDEDLALFSAALLKRTLAVVKNNPRTSCQRRHASRRQFPSLDEPPGVHHERWSS